MLSTPHGTLGTCESQSKQPETLHLSTPHGTLGTGTPLPALIPAKINQLSTPHGTLGTQS